MRRIFFPLLGLTFIVTAAPAIACVGVSTYEDRLARWNLTPEKLDAIIEDSEIIVDGVISRNDPAEAPPQTNGDRLAARLQISKVWKGGVGAELPIYMPGFVVGCTMPPMYGTPVRLAGRLDEGRLVYGKVFGLPLGNAVVDRKLRDYQVRKPFLDAERARRLEAARAETEALRRAAATGGLQAKLTFLQHLYDHGGRPSAQEFYDDLRREGVKLLPMGRFLVDPDRKDWSNLKRVHDDCYSDHANLDDAIFDRSDFADCAFRYSSFRDASFRGTDLTGSYFQDSDLTGAKYDCATKLPDDLDPKTAGMINIDEACPKP
jgi:hypothetical protein